MSIPGHRLPIPVSCVLLHSSSPCRKGVMRFGNPFCLCCIKPLVIILELGFWSWAEILHSRSSRVCNVRPFDQYDKSIFSK
ncbi:hypothetical protein FKM82_022551 [Ascaphus truei]